MRPEGAVTLPVACDLTLMSFISMVEELDVPYEKGSVYWTLSIPSQLFGFALALKAVFPMEVELNTTYKPDEWSVKREHVYSTTSYDVIGRDVQVGWSPGA